MMREVSESFQNRLLEVVLVLDRPSTSVSFSLSLNMAVTENHKVVKIISKKQIIGDLCSYNYKEFIFLLAAPLYRSLNGLHSKIFW